jgi:ABC-type antimicrobial peptide transport system permease subunit
MQLVVRATSTPAAITAGVRESLRRIDRDLPLDQLRPMTYYISGALADSEVALSLLGSFALMALALAAAGIYGVMAYAVGQRRVEFGIRLALGASPRDLLRLVASHGLRLTAIGIALGLAGARMTTMLLQDLVEGIAVTDVRVFGATAAALIVIAMTACLFPALKAAHVDPNEVL